MNPQEKELLSRFLQQLASAEAGQKDAEAEAAIREAVARQPDAAYLLVQRTLQLEQLLQASQEQVKKLEAEQGSSKGGFLNDPAWGSRSSAAPAQQPVGQRAAPATAAAAARAAPAGSWGGGLFGNIAATAAGVVAGSFLFQGIQGLMNRGDSQSPSASSDSPSADQSEQYAQAGEPELLNSYDTPEGDTSFADSGDSGGDFA